MFLQTPRAKDKARLYSSIQTMLEGKLAAIECDSEQLADKTFKWLVKILSEIDDSDLLNRCSFRYSSTNKTITDCNSGGSIFVTIISKPQTLDGLRMDSVIHIGDWKVTRAH